MLCRIAHSKLVLCLLLITVVWDGVDAGKKKKVIIKVPTHVKHVYHHHLKTVHIQRPQPKPQHHVHHDHFEEVHNDRDDYRGKRHGRGFGSWRGLEAEVERPRGYRSYSDLMKERPPPPPKGNDDADFRTEDQSGGWRPGGKSSKSGWRNNKGVVHEQNYKGKWQADDYDGPDLTYNSKGTDYGGKNFRNDYGGGKSYGKDYESSGSYRSNDYESSTGGKSYSDDYGPNNGGKNFDYGSSTGGKGFSNDYSYKNDYRSYKSDASVPSYRTSPIDDKPPHRFNLKTYRDYTDSKEVSTPGAINYHVSDSDKREVRVVPTQGGVKQVNWLNNPSNNVKSNWKSSTPSSISSVWPELKEHSSWTQNTPPTFATTLPPFNNLPDLSQSHPGTASSYVYHNFGSADAVGPQHQGSISPAVNGASHVTIRPLSSYQVQVNHYTERPVRP
ncbi:hypothetical protein LSTR_LSTR013662 [Laodelphax striatellus]|uniref:Uncharacterized protein n=1 Tax=Laodelphax striatellus TaxID=195883 RepID=A0A482WRN7_LAOST|nr:hypothetical protein LSTR_LSTR013662 [Laodelphax striatellus]